MPELSILRIKKETLKDFFKITFEITEILFYGFLYLSGCIPSRIDLSLQKKYIHCVPKTCEFALSTSNQLDCKIKVLRSGVLASKGKVD